MAILELRFVRGWSLKQAADTFLVTPATIASWLKRIDDQGANALLQLREPVNKFPDFVRRYIVQRLKTLSPAMGKVKVAETLCRAGLHLGVTTVGRILKDGLVFTPFTRHDMKAKGVSDAVEGQNSAGHKSQQMQALYRRKLEQVEPPK